jgi:hypothetical protein
MAIRYDPQLGEYVAETLAGYEVYGNTHTECALRLGEANRVHREHEQRNAEPEAAGKLEQECIVLEVEGYARGRQVLEKRLKRVRVNGGSYREAKSPDFGKAVNWLAIHDYRLVETARPRQHVGTVTVRYIYEKPQEDPEPEAEYKRLVARGEDPDVAAEAVDATFCDFQTYRRIHRHGIGDWSRDGRI